MSIAELPAGSNLAQAVAAVELEHALGAAASDVIIKLDGSRLILYGMTDSSGTRARAECVARNLPGITEVANYLYVSPLTPDIALQEAMEAEWVF